MAVDLKGAVACVTGAGRGIGAATAERLVTAGAHVVLGDIDRPAVDAVADALGPQATATHLDVTDPSSFAAFIATARDVGPISVLVNNAGVQRTGTFIDQQLDGQLREIAINLGGPMIGMRLVLEEMVERNEGHIVNVSSMAGKITVPGAAVYSASKFGVAALSRAVRAELRGTKVTVTTVFPAAVRTDLTAGLDIRGVPQSSPTSVAKAIVASCRHPRPDITVPSWVGAAGAAEHLLPEPIGELVKRAAGTQRRITADNDASRSYQERTARS